MLIIGLLLVEEFALIQFLIIIIEYSGFDILREANPHVKQFHILLLLRITVFATLAEVVSLVIAQMAE